MRNIDEKIDNTSTLPAAEFNANFRNELQNFVESAGLTLDPATGPDSDLNMFRKAVANYVASGQTYSDNGVANAYVLQRSGTIENPTAYTNGMVAIFNVGNSSTGSATTTVNIASLGIKNITRQGGGAVQANDLTANNYSTIIYNQSADRFELINNLNELTSDLDDKVDKVSSTDNAIVRFNGTSGDVQNSSITIDDNGNLGAGVTPTRRLDVTDSANQLVAFFGRNRDNEVSEIGIGSGEGADERLTILYDDSANEARLFIAGDFASALKITNGGGIEIARSDSGTAPIVERGSNANGRFIRFADGTQICETVHTFNNIAITTTTTSGLFIHAPELTRTYPATFTETPSVSMNVMGGNIGGSDGFLLAGAPNTPASSWGFRVANLISTTKDVQVGLKAIGRWY